MKKLLLISVVIFSFVYSKAQCPLTTCVDSLAYTVSSATLSVASGYTVVSWKIVSGPGVISGSQLSGLKPGATTVLSLIATDGNRISIANKVITVSSAPIIPRTVVGININTTSGVIVTFNDGTTQKL